MPYLILKGANDFRTFMAEAFDAKEQLIVSAENGSVLHDGLRIGDSLIMFAEAGDQYPVMNAGMFIYGNNADNTYH